MRSSPPVQRRQAAIGAALHRLGSDQGPGSPSGDASSGGGRALRPRAKRPRSDVTLEKVSRCFVRWMLQHSNTCAAALSAGAQQSLACSVSIPVFCIRCAVEDCCYSRCGASHRQRCSGHARWTIVDRCGAGWRAARLGRYPLQRRRRRRQSRPPRCAAARARWRKRCRRQQQQQMPRHQPRPQAVSAAGQHMLWPRASRAPAPRIFAVSNPDISCITSQPKSC